MLEQQKNIKLLLNKNENQSQNSSTTTILSRIMDKDGELQKNKQIKILKLSSLQKI